MGMISFFRTPKPRRFKYTPIFYDPRKEELEERERQIRQELGLADGASPRVSGIRGQFRRNLRRSQGGARQRNLRLLGIIAILLTITYLLFFI